MTLCVLGLAATRAGVSLAAGRTPAGQRSTLRVYAAASLVDAFDELGHVLERQRPGLTVRMSFAGSQQLASQLEQGAGAEVFAAADDRWMDEVKSHGLLAGDAAPFARNRMVVIVPATNPARISRLQDLARGGVKLLLCADAVPVGHYSREVLRNLGADPAFGSEFASRALRNLVSEEENVRSVVAKVQLGEADAGMVYRSDVSTKLRRYVRVFEIPAAANVIASYPIAVLKDAAEPAAAQAFVDLVLSREGQHVLEHYGFIPGAAATPGTHAAGPRRERSGFRG
jgi:molybdate transport system substrate-binding protein